MFTQHTVALHVTISSSGERLLTHADVPNGQTVFIYSCGLHFIISAVEMLIHSQWELNVYT